MSEICKMYKKFDGHYTPECVGDHGYRLNGHAKPGRFNFCPFCGKSIKIPEINENGDYVE